jgi:ABC-type multidrug transport system ATPase subunit/pSer/pThr/pTyr-binding forkhead associated (FHA) protein
VTSRSGYKLVVEVGPSTGQEFELTGDSYTIGRDPASDIALDIKIISRRHALLTWADDHFQIEDLGSANGTRVNGDRIHHATPLANGDQVQLGQSVRLLFEAPVPVVDMGATLLEFPEMSDATVVEEDLTVLDLGLGTELLDPDMDAAMKADDRPISAETPPPPPPPPPAAPSFSNETIVASQYKPTRPTDISYPILLSVAIAGAETRSYRLEKEVYTIGRGDDNDIVVLSKIISRHHGQLQRQPDGYVFVPRPDTGNPTLFQGRPLTGVQHLSHNDKLRIGGQDPGLMVTLTYLDSAESAATTSADQMLDFSQKSQISIGRDPSNDITVDHPIVSRFHAYIERVGQRYRVRDLRSANGTFVNDVRIEDEVWLKSDDTLRIGTYRFSIAEGRIASFDEGRGLRVFATGLNKWVRKDLNILQDISLAIQPREFIVVVGQSGGGKSTLLDAISGYRPATQGGVLVNKINVYENFDAIRNEIGYVPQRDTIHMELTTFQALDYAAQLRMPRDTTKEERHKRIMEVLEDLDIAHRKDTQISSLSGGQIKRVSIGVELLTKPGLFFLDEPTSGLDPGTETQFMQLMRRLADQGRTIILVTHATKNVMLADKVVFLARGGHLAWFGPPEEALAYFDKHRTEREQRARDIEFDEIYSILDDQSRGTAVDWGNRYKESAAYRSYVAVPLQQQAIAPAASGDTQINAAAVKGQRKNNRQISSLRQFRVLSARNVRILTRDRFSLALMLLVAPIVAMLDVILAAALGRNPFDFNDGFIPNVLITLFLPTVYAVMVGALSQMREIVKEGDIYKRERLVNLRLFPYIFSKIWVAALLALYQAAVYTLVHYVAFDMPGVPNGVVLFYISLLLATMAGMMMGLFASVLAPNPNSAPLIVIILILPQIVLGGALVPLPEAISAPTSTRWAFQAFMAITETGSDVAADACWSLPKEAREDLPFDYKNANCDCMGLNALNEESCDFPGSGELIKEVPNEVGDPPVHHGLIEPEKPGESPTPPEDPVFPICPEKPEDEGDAEAMATYFEELEACRKETETIQDEFNAERAVFEGEMDIYQARLEQFEVDYAAYQTAEAEYQRKVFEYEAAKKAHQQVLEGSAAPVEGAINLYNRDFGWLFVDSGNSSVFFNTLIKTWAAQLVIISILFVLIVVLQKRKDII